MKIRNAYLIWALFYTSRIWYTLVHFFNLVHFFIREISPIEFWYTFRESHLKYQTYIKIRDA